MTNLQYEIVKEAVDILRKFPKDEKVYREQSAIIRRILREIEPV